MRIKELIFEELENSNKREFSDSINFKNHDGDLLGQEIPESSGKNSCLNEIGFASLEEETNCLKEIGVESFEINHIIALKFREEEIIKN